MKRFKCVLLLFSFMGLMLVGCSDQSQSPVSPKEPVSLEKNNNKIEYTINSVPFLLDPSIAPAYMNIAGRTIHLKDFPVIDNVTSSDPRLTGKMEHQLTVKLDLITGEGPCNGKWTLTPDDLTSTGGGIWEGTYEGFRSKTDDPFVFSLPLKMVAHGKGGTIDGWQGFTEAYLILYTAPGTYQLPYSWTATGNGVMIMH